MEGFILLFVLAAPLLWLFCYLSYNPKTKKYDWPTRPTTKLPPKPVEDPIEAWKTMRAAQHKRERADLTQWQKDFRALQQASCTHRFPLADSLEQGWYICNDCGWERPWVWQEGCSCNWVCDRALTDRYDTKRVTYRSGNCRIHGMPRLIEHLYGKEARQFARGGIIE